MKKLRYMLEAFALGLVFILFKLMPPAAASSCGGWIGRTAGPRLAASRKARANLTEAYPGKSAADINGIIAAMWDNLGRVMAEYPHLKTIIHEYTDISGEENLFALGKDSPCIIIGGHLANWELLPFYFNYRIDWPLAGLFRAPNNPYTAWILNRARNPERRGAYIPKSAKGARAIVNTLKEGERLGILIDQKYNEGIAVPFFERPAMTSPSFAQLARRYDVPVLPLRVRRRKEKFGFEIMIYQPFHIGGDISDEEAVLKAHHMLEEWIGERPGEWLWLHRRWAGMPARAV